MQNKTGFDLYIKKKPGTQCILLTNAQQDPEFRETNYGLRTTQFNKYNSNELRILNNKILKPQAGIYFLIDSTPEKHPLLGEAFYFALPKTVVYGYAWTKNGTITIKPGVKINLRLFEKKYGDYSGKFKDQWITLKLSTLKSTPLAIKKPTSKPTAPALNEAPEINASGTRPEIPTTREIKIIPELPGLQALIASGEAPVAPTIPVSPEPALVLEEPQLPEKLKEAAARSRNTENQDALLTGGKAYLEEMIIKDAAGRELKRTIYKVDTGKNRVRYLYYIYAYDAGDKLIKITEYNDEDTLVSYYDFEYDKAGNRVGASHYDAAGNIIFIE